MGQALTGLLVGLVVLCLGLGAYALARQGTSGEPDVSAGSTVPASAPAPANGDNSSPDQTEEFLAAYERSFLGPYAVVGIQEFSNDRAIMRQEIRRARVDDRWLDQVGGGALVGRSGELRRCSDDGTQFLCTDPEPEPTLAARRSEMAQNLADGDGFAVSQRSDGCFVLSANGDGTFSPLGFETTYCFDEATGAIASKVTIKGTRTDSFVAEEIRSEVTEDDLTPM